MNRRPLPADHMIHRCVCGAWRYRGVYCQTCVAVHDYRAGRLTG